MTRDLWLSLAASALVLALAWSEPRPSDDLFRALAGGRDVLAGRLGTPDDWSFTTAGRVWLNQDWGSHVLFHAVYALAGEPGLLALKAMLLMAGAACLAFAARARGTDWALAVLVAAVPWAASRSFVHLGPSLVSLVLASALLAILTRAAARPRVLWLAVPVLALWVNADGGFVFGLGLLTLWTVVLSATMRNAAWRGALAVLAVAIGLAAFATPFGLANLTPPFVIAASPAWQRVAGWVPLFTSEALTFRDWWEAGVFIAVLAALMLGRLALGNGAPTRRMPAPASSRGSTSAAALGADAARGLAWFDFATALVVTTVALQARPFVPFALVVLTPLLASELAWWQRRLGRPWLTSLLAVAATIAVAVAAPPLVRRYDSANPIFADTTIFGRMTDAPTFPARPAEFLRANGIAGRAYAAWEWEGFLRFNVTPVTVLIGGRAHQVYDAATLTVHQDLSSGATAPRAALAEREVGLAVLPLTAPYAAPLNGLVYEEGSPWTYVYCDGRHAVLADTSRPDLAPLVAALQAGTLRYPTPAVAATSRMMYLASPRTGTAREAVRSAAEEAARVAPTGLAYAVVGDLALADPAALPATRAYLAAERTRLATLAAAGGNVYEIGQARLAVARVESGLASRVGDAKETARAQGDLALRNEDMRTVLVTWAYGWDPNVF